MRLVIELSEPAGEELVRCIRAIPSVLDIDPSPRIGDAMAPTVRFISAILEDAADLDETAYLLESLPGIRSVSA